MQVPPTGFEPAALRGKPHQKLAGDAAFPGRGAYEVGWATVCAMVVLQ
jgi:hypothetical protein